MSTPYEIYKSFEDVDFEKIRLLDFHFQVGIWFTEQELKEVLGDLTVEEVEGTDRYCAWHIRLLEDDEEAVLFTREQGNPLIKKLWKIYAPSKEVAMDVIDIINKSLC